MDKSELSLRPSVETRPLRYFLAVVETGSISKAAEVLHLSQPPLTSQIQQLERLMGTTLLVRHKRGVTPTAAGVALAEEARSLLLQAQHAVERVQQIGRGEQGQLRIGVIGTLMWSDLRVKFDRFQMLYPKVRCNLVDLTAEEQIEALKDYRIDVGLWRTPLETGDRIASLCVIREPMCVALAANHPLLAKSHLRLRDLADEPMVVIDPDDSKFGRYVLEACRNAGFVPRVAHTAKEPITRLALVASARGIALMPQSLSQIRWPGVAFRSLGRSAPHVDLYVGWRIDDVSQAVTNFCQCLTEVVPNK